MRAAAVLMALLGLGYLGAFVWREARGPGGADASGIPVQRYALRSALLDRSLSELAIVPPGGGKRGLVVLLPDRGKEPSSLLSPRLFRALGRLGARAPVVVLLDAGGGEFRDRRAGAWGSSALVEAIPDAVRRFATARRVAIGGVGSGGYAALDLARVDPGRFCAVGAHGPTLWRRATDAPADAFDGAADFARHDVFRYARTAARPFADLRVRVDTGAGDAARAADEAFARTLVRRGARVDLHVWPRGAGWGGHAGTYLRFYADALAGCRAVS